MDDPPLDFIKIGRFPAYTNAKIDILQARRRLAGGSAQPYGITSCLDETVCPDETALLAALLMTRPTDSIDGSDRIISATTLQPVDAPANPLVRYRLSHPMNP